MTINDQVELGAKAPARAAQRLGSRSVGLVFSPRRPGRRAAGAEGGGVHAPEAVVEATFLVKTQVQAFQLASVAEAHGNLAHLDGPGERGQG